MTRVSALAWTIAIGLIVWVTLAVVAYHFGRGAGVSMMRAEMLRRDSIAVLRAESIRVERGAAAAAAIASNDQLNQQLDSLRRRLEASRRVVNVVTPTTVVVHDTVSGTDRTVDVPPEITARIVSDAAIVDSLSSANARKDLTISTLQSALAADTVSLKAKDNLIATLSIPPPKPPLLDRVLARVTVPVAKVAIVGGVIYGGVRIIKSVLPR